MEKLKRSVVAFLLSAFVPGLGQIFNGQLSLGAILFACYVLWILCAGVLHIFDSFGSASLHVIALWTFELMAGIHAARVAIRQVRSGNVRSHGWRSYALAALFVCVLALMFSSNNFPERILGVRAYKLPADSMSPTLISGDRLVADMRYYKTNRPERGDVIVFKMPENDVTYIKRVIAVGGDIIAGDSQGVSINGQRASEPYLHSLVSSGADNKSSTFGPTSVPPNKVFVMGDNRNESFDSRYFGPIDVTRVVGKALYIYYSSADMNRIGHGIY